MDQHNIVKIQKTKGTIVKYGDQIIMYTVIIAVLIGTVIIVLGITSADTTHYSHTIDENGIIHVLYDGESTGECMMIVPSLPVIMYIPCED